MNDIAFKPVDRNFIAVGEQHEVQYWTETLDCSERELRSAIEVVGNAAEQVRSYLKGK